MLSIYRQSPPCVVLHFPCCLLDGFWNTLLLFHLSPLSSRSLSEVVRFFKQAQIYPLSWEPVVVYLLSRSLLLGLSVLKAGDEQPGERGKVNISVFEKYHLVVRMRSWSFTIMQNRSQVKWTVCSWSHFPWVFQVYISVKKQRLPAKCPKILYLLPLQSYKNIKISSHVKST